MRLRPSIHNSSICDFFRTKSCSPFVSTIQGWGIGNQLNKCIFAIVIAAYTNRTLVLLEPESNTSAFGCPASTINDDPSLKTLPSGLQRLVQHPEWISGNCPVPCSLPYDFWMQLANQSIDESNNLHHCFGTKEITFRFWLWAPFL
jgi:hypothetical protein